MKTATYLDNTAMAAFAPAEKIGLVATLNPEGLPHITLITSIMAKDERTLMLGQFCEGLSKQHLKQKPQAGFLVMTLARKLWRGKALWHSSVKEGEDYIRYNELPMFRYNSYFGINTVHYLDLVETTLSESLPLGKIALSLLMGAAVKPSLKTQGEKKQIENTRAEKASGEFMGVRLNSALAVFNPFTYSLLRSLSSLKFISYVDKTGFPVIIPVLQALTAGRRRIVIAPLAYGDELAAIPEGAPAAVFCLTLAMESVLLRGVWRRCRRYGFFELGELAVDWVYNSMAPCPGQIFPPVPLEPVREFC